MCPAPSATSFFSHIADRVYDFGHVSDPVKVILSSYVMSSIRLSMLVCVAANFFCACLVRDQVSETIRHIWQHSGVVHLHVYSGR